MCGGIVAKPVGAGAGSYELIDPERFFEALALRPGMAIADLGCGPGDYSIAMAPRTLPGGRVYALDLWPPCIDHVKTTALQLGITNLVPVLADIARSLPFESGSLDGCLLATLLHDFRDDGTHGRVLSEVRRVLKDGGFLAVVEYVKTSEPPGPPLWIRLSPEETESLVSPCRLVKSGVRVLGPSTYVMTFEKRGAD